MPEKIADNRKKNLSRHNYGLMLAIIKKIASPFSQEMLLNALKNS
jgi:hypothetical protein